MFSKEVNLNINQKNKEEIIHALHELEVVNYDTVSDLVPKLFEKNQLQLNLSVYKPRDPENLTPCGIGRHLLYDHKDEKNPFSIWIFAFATRQITSIHDHKFKGTVIVLQGPISEKYYLPTEGNRAKLVKRSDRYRFHCNKDSLDTPNEPFVHQLKRRKNLDYKEEISITLHIYNMPASTINDLGETVDMRNLNKIYIKDPSYNKAEIPAYTEEYPSLTCKSP
jgi:hypothetical protein